MSARITNKQREEFIESALREAFAPRFAEIEAEALEVAKAQLKGQHPKFLELAADPEARQYLAIADGVYLTAQGEEGRYNLRKPSNYEKFECREYASRRHYVENLSCLQAHLDRPAYRPFELVLPEELVAEYHQVWADLKEAKETLTSTIYTYTTHEKFRVDFPQLAQHLPPPPLKACTSVAVPVEDVLLKLAKVGIPPKEEPAAA